jgi:hypothetical protein
MTPGLNVTLPKFPLAFILSPFAGAAGAMVAVVIASIATGTSPTRVTEFVGLPLLVGFFALVIVGAVTIVTGLCVVAYVRLRGHVPTLTAAVTVGVLIACAFAAFVGGRAAFAAVVAVGAAMPNACAFWWLGLRGRVATRRA